MYCISLDNERNIWKGKLSKEQRVNMIEKHKCRILYCIFLNSSNKSYSTKKKQSNKKTSSLTIEMLSSPEIKFRI